MTTRTEVPKDLRIDSESEFRAHILSWKDVDYQFGWEVPLDSPRRVPPHLDCSEMVELIFHRSGVKIPDGSYNQRDASRPFKGELQTGDLFFLEFSSGRTHHVGMYLSKLDADGRPIPGKGIVVEERGKDYDYEITTVAAVNKRGAIWKRHPGFDKKLKAWRKAVVVKPKPAPKPDVPKNYPLKLKPLHVFGIDPEDRLPRVHSKGANVIALQKQHNAWAADQTKPVPLLKADGDYGKKTGRSMRTFRMRNRLGFGTVTGPRTWRRLFDYDPHNA